MDVVIDCLSIAEHFGIVAVELVALQATLLDVETFADVDVETFEDEDSFVVITEEMEPYIVDYFHEFVVAVAWQVLVSRWANMMELEEVLLLGNPIIDLHMMATCHGSFDGSSVLDYELEPIDVIAVDLPAANSLRTDVVAKLPQNVEALKKRHVESGLVNEIVELELAAVVVEYHESSPKRELVLMEIDVVVVAAVAVDDFESFVPNVIGFVGLELVVIDLLNGHSRSDQVVMHVSDHRRDAVDVEQLVCENFDVVLHSRKLLVV